MADDEERTSSDSEAEVIEAAIEDSDEDVRYSLRPRRVSKTRMTKRGQERYERYDVHGRRPRVEDGMSWLDNHRVFEEQSQAGARAIERIVRPAARVSDELDIYPAPRPLLVEGHRHSRNADRIGPKTRKYEAARWADESRVTGQERAAGPRRGRDDFYKGFQSTGSFTS